MTENNTTVPIACMKQDGVFTPETARRHQEIWKNMEVNLLKIEELETGYAFRFPLKDELFREIAEYITYERLCCPFFHFGLDLDPTRNEVCLRLTGGQGVKGYLEAVLADRN